MKVQEPFIPLRVETNELHHTISVVGRSYTFGPDGMITSVIVNGEELLAEPMRIVLSEDGESAAFDNNYPENESESFVQSRSDRETVICGCKQSERFIVNFCNTVRYDGSIDVDLKLMTRGRTVAQVFGLAEAKPLSYKLDKMWLEIPLKKEIAAMYHINENDDIFLSDGSVMEKTRTTSSGMVPALDAAVSFKPLLWLGNDEKGLGWYAETKKNWQTKDNNKALEIIHDENKIILRVHLLDGHPRRWNGSLTEGNSLFKPIEYRFGFIATPVKPFPKNPYIHKAFHLDCGIKIKGNYMDFLLAENRFDRLADLGVDTLILHEKWNKSQNWFELSEFTAKQLKFIVDECHKRSIKVLPYFGYEVSTMSPAWTELKEDVVNRSARRDLNDGWWRLPFQRDFMVCYNSKYEDMLVNGIEKLMDEYNIDGIYFDGTSMPNFCTNINHGCGWYDEDGQLQGSYPIGAIRRFFEKVYNVVKPRGGEINVHCNGLVNYTALPYIDQSWLGENLQFELNKGTTKDVDIDYFRVEYSGRNMGVPAEFIAYENRPLWTFEQALSCSILHGILPRPNDIEYPLELISRVWAIIEKFPVEKAEWLPYHKNNAKTTSEKVKVSYYKHTTITGEPHLLAFVVNISSAELNGVKVEFDECVTKCTNAETMEEQGFCFDMKPYGYKILYIN